MQCERSLTERRVSGSGDVSKIAEPNQQQIVRGKRAGREGLVQTEALCAC